MTTQMKRVSFIVIAAVLVVGLSLLGAALGGVFSGTPTVQTGTSGGETSQVGDGTPSGGGGGGTVIQGDGIITGNIVDIRPQTSGYPGEVDVMVQSSSDVDSLPNPTADKVGQVITVKTDESLSGFQAGQMITAHVKYVGDVPMPGIVLYMYEIKATSTPTPLPPSQYSQPYPY